MYAHYITYFNIYAISKGDNIILLKHGTYILNEHLPQIISAIIIHLLESMANYSQSDLR